ncbi:alcohol dehydrogenase [Gracilaria domingensis]|nr:alcohol dehydrogenase [Gracilaria domingensis]
MPMPTAPQDDAPEGELDPNLVKLACQNRIRNRSKRSPEWIFFADAGMWQTVNGEESKFRIANCRYCLKADIETRIRGKIETMKNHILECDKIPASQKAVYERHPARFRKRQSGANAVDPSKRLKYDGLLKANAHLNVDGVENKAIVLHGAGDLRIEKVPIPAIPEGHVLVAMRSVGICGSDVHYWTDGRIGDFIIDKPMILGHEGSGVVRLVGENVTNVEEGDRVAMEPGVPCGGCTLCSGGRYNLCPHVKFAATPPVHGSLAHFVVHPARFLYRLSPMISFDEAALFEPLSVGIHACRRGGVKLGSTVLITGAGPIGLMCMLVAKASGASQISILDIDTDRLQVAKELGANRVVLTHSEADPKVSVEGMHADVCIEASGVDSAIRACVYGAKRGGVVVLVGMGRPEVALPLLEIGIREIDIRGVFRYCNTYPIALDLVHSGKVNLKRLVTHRFKMLDAMDAFEAARNRASKAIKVIIDCTPQPTQPVSSQATNVAPSIATALPNIPNTIQTGLNTSLPTSLPAQVASVATVGPVPPVQIAMSAAAAATVPAVQVPTPTSQQNPTMTWGDRES